MRKLLCKLLHASCSAPALLGFEIGTLKDHGLHGQHAQLTGTTGITGTGSRAPWAPRAARAALARAPRAVLARAPRAALARAHGHHGHHGQHGQHGQGHHAQRGHGLTSTTGITDITGTTGSRALHMSLHTAQMITSRQGLKKGYDITHGHVPLRTSHHRHWRHHSLRPQTMAPIHKQTHVLSEQYSLPHKARILTTEGPRASQHCRKTQHSASC